AGEHSIVTAVNRRAVRQQREGQGRAAVIVKEIQERIKRSCLVADVVIVDAVGKAGAGIAVTDDVVALAGERAKDIPARRGISGNDRIANADRAGVVVYAAARGIGAVGTNCVVGQLDGAAVV